MVSTSLTQIPILFRQNSESNERLTPQLLCRKNGEIGQNYQNFLENKQVQQKGFFQCNGRNEQKMFLSQKS